MPTPSEKAKQLVEEIHESGDYDAATIIDTALNEARLEGAKAMQEASCAAIKNSKLPGLNKPIAYGALSALDQQQVINESVK